MTSIKYEYGINEKQRWVNELTGAVRSSTERHMADTKTYETREEAIKAMHTYVTNDFKNRVIGDNIKIGSFTVKSSDSDGCNSMDDTIVVEYYQDWFELNCKVDICKCTTTYSIEQIEKRIEDPSDYKFKYILINRYMVTTPGKSSNGEPLTTSQLKVTFVRANDISEVISRMKNQYDDICGVLRCDENIRYYSIRS